MGHIETFLDYQDQQRTNKAQSQLANLCRDFLRTQSGRTYDAIRAAQHMRAWWGIDVDWHQMAYALDHLREAGQAVTTGKSYDGHQAYRITAGTPQPAARSPAQRLQDTDDLAAHLYREERKRDQADRDLGRQDPYG